LTFPCFDLDATDDPNELRQLALEGHFAFQDYAIAKWFFHVNAFVKSGAKFLEESKDRDKHLYAITVALDEFMMRFSEENWDDRAVTACKADCDIFQNLPLYENLFLLTSYIYTFQQKGFEAKHQISIKSLSEALERNRELLEELPRNLSSHERHLYGQFYDEDRRFKCTRITCRYFSEGFTDAKSKKKHLNMHNRPYYCDVANCLGNEGFANNNDLLKYVTSLPPRSTIHSQASTRHTRAFHPDMCDLADKFRTATTKQANAVHACSICGKTFTRKFHRRDHELSHTGQRPHECPECGKAFTRLNDMKRHRKLHERN
jgi:DNA-directed RNA polymerase subunit RPC12/RpoP